MEFIALPVNLKAHHIPVVGICEHGKEGPQIQFSIETSKGYLESVKEARLALRVANSIGVKVGERKWIPPVQGVFRLDVDASVNEQAQAFGVGAVEGLVPFVIYSDSLLAIQLLSDGAAEGSYIAQDLPILVDVINNGLISDFCHMYREANIVAHTFARYGTSCDDMIIWNSNYPHLLRDMVE
ncbi:hypothetical protein C2S51_020554 [Perilla frutescens var. frutescens]|nr:hypothetical protein C2S51_020554 [Perilla frutescens var. frutescens]